MIIYGIKKISSSWDGCSGCDTSESLLDYFFSTRENAEENLLEDCYEPGYSATYEVVEIELDSRVTKPEYRKQKR